MNANLCRYHSILPLAGFRVGFGIVMFIGTLRAFLKGWPQSQYIDPVFHFRYFGFEWLPIPNAPLVYILFFCVLISSVCITLGLCYRVAAVVFFCSFVYLELVDAALYLNHYYFISLVALALPFLPAHHALSIDSRLALVPTYGHIPYYFLRFVRVLVGGLYFMAGIAKLNAPWLLEALPLRIWLPQHNGLPLIGSIMDDIWLAYAFSWMGAAFDLSIPFLLSHRRTRPWAYCTLIVFHLLTYSLFPIGMFPFVMIVCAMVFFEEVDWSKLFPFFSSKARYRPKAEFRSVFSVLSILLLFLVFIFPFRYIFYPPGLFWHEQGYRFSWRVMLMEKAGKCFFYVKDPEQPGLVEIDPADFLTPGQEKQMSTQPDLILQFAQHLDAVYREAGIANPEVFVRSYVSLNGQGSRLFIDPEVDLSSIHDGWQSKAWILLPSETYQADAQ